MLLETQLLQLQNHSIKSFLQSLHLLHGLKFSITDSSSSFLTYGYTVTGISSSFVCLLHLNDWHSLPLHIHLCKPPFCCTLL